MKAIAQTIINKVEQIQIGFGQLVFWLLFVGIARYVFEQVLFLRVYVTQNRFFDGIYFFVFYSIVFLYSSILVKLYSGGELKKVIGGSVFVFPILIIIPVVDFYLDKEPYTFIDYTYSLFDSIKDFPGITLMGLYLMFLGAFYVTVKKNVFRGVIAFVNLFLIYYYVLASRLLEDVHNFVLSQSIPRVLPLELASNVNQSTMNLINILVMIFLLIPFCYFYDQEFFRKIWVRLRVERGLQYLLMVFFGFTLVGDFHPFRLFILGFNCIGIYFLWLGSVLVNDFYDLETDRINHVSRNVDKPLTKKEAQIGTFVLWGIGLLIALHISTIVFFIYLILMIVSYLYSAPPIRFKQYLFSPILIGLCAFFLVLIGVLSNVNLYYLTERVIRIALLFGVTLGLGVSVIDLKDYEGDLRTNIRNIVTLLGMRKAQILISFVTGLAYVVIGFVLVRAMKTNLYYTALLPAVVMPVMILKYRDTKLWWSGYFLFHIITLFNGALINIFFANYHLIFKFNL